MLVYALFILLLNVIAIRIWTSPEKLVPVWACVCGTWGTDIFCHSPPTFRTFWIWHVLSYTHPNNNLSAGYGCQNCGHRKGSL